MKKVRKAVIPVAGLGTRFLPATKAIPKELLPLVDTPVLQHIVEEATSSGITEIIFVTNENKIAIEQYFAKDDALECLLEQKQKHKELESIKRLADLATFVFVLQREPLGLGHAVLQAADVIGDEPFIVMGGDDVVESSVPATRQLITVYEQQHASVIGVMEVAKDAVHRYGIVHPELGIDDTTWKISDIVEKPQSEVAPSRLAVGGRWLLTPAIFDHLRNTKPGAADEIQLTDGIRSLMRAEGVYAKQYEGTYRDCGNKLEYVKAVISFAMKHPDIGAAVKQHISTVDVS